jgi:C_GCAxxG_C_C family probable redox protein
MGRLQEKCGAVTGSFMVIGIYCCKKFMDNNTRKDESYSMIQQFNEKFISINGSTECKSLIKYDISTEEGRKMAKENKVFDTICEKCVLDSITILDKLFKD